MVFNNDFFIVFYELPKGKVNLGDGKKLEIEDIDTIQVESSWRKRRLCSMYCVPNICDNLFRFGKLWERALSFKFET